MSHHKVLQQNTDRPIAKFIPSSIVAEAMRYRLLAQGLPERDVEDAIKQAKQARQAIRLTNKRAKSCGLAL